jgi:hypothetical protein
MSLKDAPPLPGVPKMTFVSPTGNIAHMMPTVAAATARAQAAKAIGQIGLSGNNMTYQGGPVMQPYQAVYNIYWAPPHLQNGGATGFDSLYGTVTVLHSAWNPGHGLMNIDTQYYQTVSSTTTYINNNGGLGGYYVDSAAYPASGCTDSATAGGCITDAQIQAEITKVMNANGWTGGMNKIFMLFTSSGEGSCFDNTNSSCSYTQYCGYHSSFTLNGQSVLYANMPYGNQASCQCQGQSGAPCNGFHQTMPNGSLGDLANNTANHEINETATDPFGTAWYYINLSGEIGDLCNFNFGTNTWGSGSGAGNQMWNGWIFELQMLWDNHSTSCLQVGPS